MEGPRKSEPNLAEREAIRNKQGVHDPEKAEDMARASNGQHEMASNYRKGGNEQAHEQVEEAAEKKEIIGGIIYELTNTGTRLSKKELEVLARIVSDLSALKPEDLEVFTKRW